MKKTKTEDSIFDQIPLPKVESIDEMPLETLRDYRLYNDEARKLNKKLKLCRYQIKQCPTDLHPKQKVKLENNDQTTHPIKVFLSNHLIHFDEELDPGKVHELPECVITYLSEKGYPIYERIEKPDGSKNTIQVGKKARFSVTSVWEKQEW